MTAAAVGGGVGRWVLLGAVVVIVQLALLHFRNRLRVLLFSERGAVAELMRAYAAAFRPLLLLEDVDPLQYWVTTWNDATRRRWRRAVLVEQSLLAAGRGVPQRALPRGA